MQLRRALSVAIMLGAACAACTDGVGTPIRAPVLAGDAGAHVAGDGEHERFDVEHCSETLEWPDALEAEERALLAAINRLRGEGFRCGGERSIAAQDPLELSPSLRCSARLHSRDMAERDFLGHTNPDGDNPRDRMRRAGYDVGESNEILVVGEPDAASALEDMLGEWDECNDLGSRRMTHVGIGRYAELWTLDFAGPDDDDDHD